jgi:hypothetical protein
MLALLGMAIRTFHGGMLTHQGPLGISRVVKGRHRLSVFFWTILVAFYPVGTGCKNISLSSQMLGMTIGTHIFTAMVSAIL